MNIWSSLIAAFGINDNIGASLIGITVKIKDCETSISPSLKFTVTSMSPLKSPTGSTVKVASSIETLAPCVAEAENSKDSLSISEPSKEIVKTLSSSIDWSEMEAITGASFTGKTVNVKDCSDKYSPSNAEIITRPLPDQFATGAIFKVLFENNTTKLSSTVALKNTISPSTLYTSNSYDRISSSFIIWVSMGDNTGASFIGLTFNINDCWSNKSPSETVTSTFISPLKFSNGVITKSLSINEISALPSTSTSNDKSSKSTSEAVISKRKILSSSTVWSSIKSNIGASLTGLTLIVTTPIPDVHSPSVTVNVKLSWPLKSIFGVYITCEELPDKFNKIPFPGFDVKYESSSPFGSVASNVIVIVPESSSILIVW